MSLWNFVSEQVTKLIQQILDGNLTELEDALRAHSLCRSFSDISTEDIQFLADEIFPRYELWYFDAALSDFSAEQIKSFCESFCSVRTPGRQPTSRLSR